MLLRAALLTCLLLDASGHPASAATHYSGSWQNLAFGTTGPVAFDIDLTPPMYEFTFNFGGSVFGFGDPPPVTLSGPTAPPGEDLTFSGVNSFFGNCQCACQTFRFTYVTFQICFGFMSASQGVLTQHSLS